MAIISPPIQELIEQQPRYVVLKRIVDVVVTLLALPILIPLFLIVAISIRLDSEGPIFFKQKRVGLNGAEFTCYKFRSMFVNSDDSIHREAFKQYKNGSALGNGESGNTHKLTNDPRITRIGRIIRKVSFDELPQVINILRGEMSLVGPRPPIPYEVQEYSERERLRLCGKPGLTGFWQVYGRSRVTFDKMVDMDITYLQQQSIWLDLKLIVLTVPVLLTGRGGA
jgi:lipopolysaccharide/colanic/teichoic acid biosynthesis glycosyltransferase